MDSDILDTVEIQIKDSKFIFFEILVGFLGIICSFASVFVATFIGVTQLSLQNGSLLLLLAILIFIFLIIRLINYIFEDSKKNMLICFIILSLNILVFVLNVLKFISIPLLFIT